MRGVRTFPQGNDLVDGLDRRMASALGLADLLRVAAALRDEILKVKHDVGFLVGRERRRAGRGCEKMGRLIKHLSDNSIHPGRRLTPSLWLRDVLAAAST